MCLLNVLLQAPLFREESITYLTWESLQLVNRLPVHLEVIKEQIVTTSDKFSVIRTFTACFNKHRIRVVGVQANQAHTLNVQTLGVLNLNFQPIILRYIFYSIETWHPCTFCTKIRTLMDLAEN